MKRLLFAVTILAAIGVSPVRAVLPDEVMSDPAKEARARVLFMRAGQFDFGAGHVTRVRAVKGRVPSNVELHLVYNATPALLSEFERVDEAALARAAVETFLADSERASKDGARVAGLQLDFDVPTRLLARYGRVLKTARASLPANTRLSVTGLPTWMSADATLRAMLDADLRGAAFGCVWDPMSVRACAEAGVGATFPLRIGGKSGEASGDPLDVIATVKALRSNHDQQGLGPSRAQLGDAAWIEAGGIDVILSSARTQVFAPDAFTGLGMSLEGRRVVAVKSSRHFEAGFKPIADRIVTVATPGAIQMDFAAIAYRRKRVLDFFPRVPDPLGLG